LRPFRLLLLLSLCFSLANASAQVARVGAETDAGRPSVLTLTVDATEAQRKIFHAHITLPVTPGPLTLCYPQWIPGEHAPNGPVADTAGLIFSAEGKTIPWKRDPIDMYAYHLEIPSGVASLEIAMDYLSLVETQAATFSEVSVRTRYRSGPASSFPMAGVSEPRFRAPLARAPRCSSQPHRLPP
jgi:hypothetical protein